MMRGLAFCGLKGDPQTVVPAGMTAEERACPGCDRIVMVSPSTAALGDAVTAMCNDCGKKVLAEQATPVTKVMAPGAYDSDDQWSRRRRSELEAHGFRDLSDDEKKGFGL